VFSLSVGSVASPLWASNAKLAGEIEAAQELQSVHEQLRSALDSPIEYHGGIILAFDLKTVDATKELMCLFLRPNVLVKKNHAFWRFVGDVVTKVQRYLDHQFTQKTELLQLRRERESRDILYQLIFENSQDGIMFSAPDGRIASSEACLLRTIVLYRGRNYCGRKSKTFRAY